MKRLSWWRIALLAAFAASLAGNFFAFGYIFESRRETPSMPVLAQGALAPYSEDVRTEFRRVLRENRPRTVAALAKLRETRQHLGAVASASPLDEAEARQAMAEVRSATDALQRLMQDQLLVALRNLDEARVKR